MSALPNEIGCLISPPSGGTTLSIQVCHTWAELQAFRADWNHLLQLCSTSSIFQTPEWLSAWWMAFGANKVLLALIFSDPTGETVGIALFCVEQQRSFGMSITALRLAGAGSGDSDALDFITAPGYEEPCSRAFLAWLKENCTWDICTLETLPHGSPGGKTVSNLVQASGWKLYSETTPNFFIDLPRTWSEYLERLDAGFRPLLTRYPKRLRSRYTVSIQRCEREEDLDSALQALFTLHQMRWSDRGEPGAFSVAERRAFYFEMAKSFLQSGWLEFWLLKLEQEIVAAQFCFRYGKTIYLLQEGFNPQYAPEKVGYALRAHVLQEMIRTGADRYDFLGGADAYKLKFGAQEGCYLTLRFAGPSWRGRVHLALQYRKQKIKKWLKRKLPAGVLARLRHQKASIAAGQKESTE